MVLASIKLVPLLFDRGLAMRSLPKSQATRISATHNVLSKNLEEKLELDCSWRQNCEHNNLAFTSFNDRNGR